MKKLLLTLTVLFLSFGTFAQNRQVAKISLSPGKSSLETADTKKPLLVIEYGLERLNLGASVGNPLLEEIDLELVNSYEVYKGASAKAAFGDDAKDGVILIQLKKNKAAKTMFEDFKKLANTRLLINTKKKIGIDETTGFPIGKPTQLTINNSNELAKLRKLRPGNYEPQAIFIMSLNGKERLIKNPSELEGLGDDSLKSVEVLKDGASKARYMSNGKDVIIATFNSSKETKRFFRKLKKIKNK